MRHNESLRPGAWRASLALVLLVGTLGMACGPEFEPYFKVQELRVMGLRADKPWIKPGEQAQLDALVSVPQEGDAVSYEWSWCPFSTGSTDGYRCAVSHEELQSQVEGLGLSILPYELGNQPTAQFPYPVPPELIQAFCSTLQSQDVPDFITLPDCEKGFDVTVKLVVRSGDAEITSVRQVRLVINPDGEQNQNPVLGGMAVKPMGATRESATPLNNENLVMLSRDEDFDLIADFTEASSEGFVTTDGESDQEVLVVSWFVEGGELGSRRTGYLPPDDTIEDSNLTTWRTPEVKDYPEEELEVFAVLRDGRGGMDWKRYLIRLETP